MLKKLKIIHQQNLNENNNFEIQKIKKQISKIQSQISDLSKTITNSNNKNNNNNKSISKWKN